MDALSHNSGDAGRVVERDLPPVSTPLGGIRTAAGGAASFAGAAAIDARDVVREALEKTGDMDALRARLRAAIFQVVDGSATLSGGSSATALPPPENVLINEMIREYLAFNGYAQTLSVFSAEARLPKIPVPRAIVASELALPGAPVSVPMLYAIVEEGKTAAEQL